MADQIALVAKQIGRKARLLDEQRSKQETAQAESRRLQVGSGDRSQRIRTYNFPQGRVTDHRHDENPDKDVRHTEALGRVLDRADEKLAEQRDESGGDQQDERRCPHRNMRHPSAGVRCRVVLTRIQVLMGVQRKHQAEDVRDHEDD